MRPIRDAVICKGIDPETYWRCTLSSGHTGMHMYIRNGYTQKTWPQKKPGDTRRCNDVSPSYSDGTYNCTLPSGHAGSWHNAPGHEWFRVKG